MSEQVPNKKSRIRSQNPERIRTPNLIALRELVVAMTEEELLIGRNLLTHELAKRVEFCDEGPRQADLDWANGIIAIDEANLRCIEETGERLRTMNEYDKRFKSEGAPTARYLAKLFYSWPEALAIAGVLAVGQPEAELTRRQGRPPAGTHKWTYDECIHAVALVTERNAGRRISSGTYDQTIVAMNRPMPSYEDVRKAVTGVSGKSQGAWDKVRTDAYTHIRKNPKLFPRSFDYLTRTRAIA